MCLNFNSLLWYSPARYISLLSLAIWEAISRCVYNRSVLVLLVLLLIVARSQQKNNHIKFSVGVDGGEITKKGIPSDSYAFSHS
jgi:hypothetical protein